MDDFGYASIAKQLNTESIRPPGGKNSSLSTKKWNAVAIQRILSNRVYLGDTVQGVSEKLSFKTKKTRRLPKEEWCITKNTHNPIIDTEMFYEIEEKIKSKSLNFSGTHKAIINSFSGIAFCGSCNSPLYARKRTGRPSGYVCSNYIINGSKSCTSHFVREEELCDIIIGEIEGVLNDQILLDTVGQLLNKETTKNNFENKQDKVKKQIELKIRQQEELYMDKLEGKITEELFLRMNKNFEEQIRKLKDQTTVKEEVANFKDPKNLLREILELARSNSLPHELVRLLIYKIAIFEEDECLYTSTNGENNLMGETSGIIEVELRY